MSVYRHPEHHWQPLMEKVIATHEWGLHIGLQALPKFTQDLPLSKLISELHPVFPSNSLLGSSEGIPIEVLSLLLKNTKYTYSHW